MVKTLDVTIQTLNKQDMVRLGLNQIVVLSHRGEGSVTRANITGLS